MQRHVIFHNAESLNGDRMLGMLVLSGAVFVADVLRGGASAATVGAVMLISPSSWGLLLLSVALSGFLGSLLQYEAQRTLPASNAQPFLAVQPLFAALWASIFLRECVQAHLAVSGALIMGGAMLASTDRSTVHRNRIT